MGDRPNIFEYATKELSQDAMICWFLACLESKDEFYKKIGVEFARFILDDKKTNEEDIHIDIDTLHAQYYRMDVYAVLCVENKAITIIFEDKTDTYLHSNQMKKYCDTVNGWKNEKYLGDINIKERNGVEKLEWGKTRYIYFKTGYVPEWQKKDIEEQKKEFVDVEFVEIYIDNIIDFLEKLIKRLSTGFPDRKETLIYDYIEHLKEKQKQNKEGKFAKWDKIMQRIIGEETEFHYDYQGWAVYNILEFGNYIEYNLRCGSYKIGDAICFQQYRDDGKKKNRKDSELMIRKKNAQRVRNICEEIIPELKSKYNIEFNMENNDGCSQNTFFRVPIPKEDNDEAKKICAFFKEFIGKFVEKVKKDTELSKNLKEVFYERTDIL